MIFIFDIVSALLFLLGFVFFFHGFLHRKENDYHMEEDISSNPKFAVLIPARNESEVISDLLLSLQKQTKKIPMNQVFVIVESTDDPTVQIGASFGATVFVRKHLEKKSKGYALEELIEHLASKNEYYDAYFIFDADNVLDSHYLEVMEQDYFKGYAISTGYRNFKNGNESLVAAASGLIYCFINEWCNKSGLKHRQNIMLSGTGFYIHGKYIREWKTYPFHSLTEDVELSYYATLHGLSTHYNDQAIFYDEQPLSFRQSVIQRKRWIKGYLVNWVHSYSKFRKQLKNNPDNRGSLLHMMYGIWPLALMIFGLLCLLFSWIIESLRSLMVESVFTWSFLFISFGFLLWIYFMLVLITYLIIYHERGKIKMDKKMQFRVLWYHPIFLLSYIYVFFLVLVQKNIGWDPISHGSSSDSFLDKS